MIAERLIHPCSKLATTREWHTTTLAEELSVQDADEDDLYEAMDWLWPGKERIEKKLAQRHLTEGRWFCTTSPAATTRGGRARWATFGHDRDGQKGLPIIVYGVLTDHEGRPIAVERLPGQHGRSDDGARTRSDKLRQAVRLVAWCMVGDRGMLTQPQIDKLKEHPGLGWITALTTALRFASW